MTTKKYTYPDRAMEDAVIYAFDGTARNVWKLPDGRYRVLKIGEECRDGELFAVAQDGKARQFRIG